LIFVICATLHNIFFPFILFNKIHMFVNFYYKLILINKFIKHNRVNDPCCAIKYLDLYLAFNYCNFIFLIINLFFYQIMHDRYVILTYLMFRSWISRVNSNLSIVIFFFIYFLLLIAHFYCIIKLFKI
jgi:hypothetical protein